VLIQIVGYKNVCTLKSLHTTSKFSHISVQAGRKYVFKLIVENENLHEISHDNWVRIIIFVHQSPIFINITFLHCIIYKLIMP
jgi:hypothetical protein